MGMWPSQSVIESMQTNPMHACRDASLASSLICAAQTSRTYACHVNVNLSTCIEALAAQAAAML